MQEDSIRGGQRAVSLARRILKRRAVSDERGSALIEFAVCATAFITLMFGIIEFGFAIYSYNFVSNAAREASRYAMVRGSTCSGLSGGCPMTGCTQGASCPSLLTYVESIAVGINTTNLSVQATCTSGGTYSALPCAPGTAVQVKVQYTFALFKPLSARTLTMVSTSQRTVWQ